MKYVVELIDTLWNVNLLQHKCLRGTLRINRYIMECKYLFRLIREQIYDMN